MYTFVSQYPVRKPQYERGALHEREPTEPALKMYLQPQPIKIRVIGELLLAVKKKDMLKSRFILTFKKQYLYIFKIFGEGVPIIMNI